MQYKLRRLPPCEFDSEIHQGKPINWAEVDQAFLAERLVT